VPTGLSSNLDLLRAIAVLLVLTQHVCRRAHLDQVGWVPISCLGLFGVLLFFVHTCLVLMYSMERSHLRGWRLFTNFHVRRIFRIYPLSLLTVATALALHLTSDVNDIRGLSVAPLGGKREILANFLLVQNLAGVKSIVNVLWSLPYELQMYLLLPFLFLWVRGKRRFWALLGLWLLSVGAALVQPRAPFGLLSILVFIPHFLPGVIAYSLPHVPRIKSYLWPVLILSLVIIFTFHPTLRAGWVLCLALGLGIPWFGEITTPWLRTVSNRIATYSYGIYLSHQFSIWIALGVLAQRSLWLRIPVLLALLGVLPVVLYHAIERPMIQAGIRLANRWCEARVEPLEAVAAT
jgi:peptidoglycan/LPS O-acetylase OafA/YrhL